MSDYTNIPQYKRDYERLKRQMDWYLLMIFRSKVHEIFGHIPEDSDIREHGKAFISGDLWKEKTTYTYKGKVIMAFDGIKMMSDLNELGKVRMDVEIVQTHD